MVWQSRIMPEKSSWRAPWRRSNGARYCSLSLPRLAESVGICGSSGTGRSSKVYFKVETGEEMGGRKSDGVADVIIAIARAARGRSVQPHAHIIEDLGAIVDERPADQRLAHHVRGVEHEITVGIQLDQPQLMRGKGGALAVGHLIERAGSGAF